MRSNNLHQVLTILARFLVKLKVRIQSSLDFIFIAVRIFLLKPDIIWIGDSHAHFLSGSEKRMKPFSLKDGNQLVIWLGPILLYQVSKNGFRVNKRVKIMLSLAANKQRIIFVLGEIDCRVHFVNKTLALGSDEFNVIAHGYKKSVTQLIKTYDLAKAIIIAPLAPSDYGLDNQKFPRNGLLSQRVLVTKMITESLARISSSEFTVINISPLLSIQNGSLNKKYTDDGVHLNATGLKIISKIDFKNV